MLKKYNNVTVYIDMDGVLNKFEDDANARKNMWKKGYFEDIPSLENIAFHLSELNKIVDVIILTKVIDREGVIEEKNKWIENNLTNFIAKTHEEVIYVPYAHQKSNYIKDFTKFNILIDDGVKNLEECSLKGIYCIYFGNKIIPSFLTINKASDLPNILNKLFLSEL